MEHLQNSIRPFAAYVAEEMVPTNLVPIDGAYNPEAQEWDYGPGGMQAKCNGSSNTDCVVTSHHITGASGMDTEYDCGDAD